MKNVRILLITFLTGITNGFEFTFVLDIKPLCIKTHLFLPNWFNS